MFKNKIHNMTVCALVAALICSIGCSSSSSTGPSNGSDLVGTWKLTSILIGTQTLLPEETELQLTITFRNDGTFTSAGIEEGVTETGSGIWRVEGNTLVIVESGETEIIPYTLSGNTLRFTITEDGETFTLVFTRQ